MAGAFKTQPNDWSCGVLAVWNALHALGYDANYHDIRKLSKENCRNGTERQGIIRAIIGLGYRAIPYRSHNADNAWSFARRWAMRNPIIALVDGHTHYFTLSGVIDGRVIVVDSGANTTGNEMGAFVFSKQELIARWIHRGSVYGIRVSR